MLHKDFFRLVVKLFGLFSLTIVLFTVLPQIAPQLVGFGEWYAILFIPVILAIPVLLFLFLLFKTDLIIKWLKLEKGFDDERMMLNNMTSASILKLACIVIGGLLIIDNIPILLNQGLALFKSSLQHHQNDSKEFYYFGVSAVKIIIGYLMIRNFVWVGRLLGVV